MNKKFLFKKSNNSNEHITIIIILCTVNIINILWGTANIVFTIAKNLNVNTIIILLAINLISNVCFYIALYLYMDRDREEKKEDHIELLE